MGLISTVIDKFTERKYAAAKKSSTLGPFNPSRSTVNDEIETSWDTVVNRQSQLIRDMPIFSGAVNAMESFFVGDGIIPQWNVTDSRGNPDKKTSQKIEDHFMAWANDPTRCDMSGKLTYWDQQRLLVRTEAEFGEYLFLESVNRDTGYNLSAIEPTRLSDPGFNIIKPTGNNIAEWRGLKYNTNTLKVLSYVFSNNPDANTFDFETKEVPANRIIHGFKHVRPGQLRGMTEFASAILSAHMLKDYMSSELTAQNLSSRWLAFITAPVNNNWTNNQNPDIQLNEFYDRYMEAMDYATIQHLKNGEQVEVNTQQRQAGGFKDFNEIVIRYISASTGLPYELLSQNYSGLNFTTLRGVRNDFKQHLRARWQRIITHFCKRSADKWLKAEVMSGRLQLNGYFTNPERFHRMRWITPALEQVDPLKEFTAELLKVNAGMKSPQSVIKSMGEDPDRVIEETAQWRDRLDEKDLTFQGLSSKDIVTANFELVEEVEPEEEPQDDSNRQYAEDEQGNLYRKEDGLWKPLK